MAVHTAIIRLVNVDNSGKVVYKTNSTIEDIARAAGTAHRVYQESTGSAPNAASGNSTTAPSIHEYLTAEDSDGYNLIHMDQFYIITSNV